MRDHQFDMNADLVAISDADDDDDDDDDEEERHVLEWEDGLPSAGDLTPLSQLLIPPELATAFRINPELPRTILDVHRASQSTFSSLRSITSPVAAPTPSLAAADESSPKSSKKPRLVWTPQLHKRFVEVVAHLGLKNAVPKTIMQLMNVEGLTRENVASHLQKYRLYVKRMHGISDDAPLSPTTSAAASRDTNGPSRSYPLYGDSSTLSYPPPPPPPSQHRHHGC